MLTLVFIGALFTVFVIAITVYAVNSAQDGIEDCFGFHAISPAVSPVETRETLRETQSTLPLLGIR